MKEGIAFLLTVLLIAGVIYYTSYNTPSKAKKEGFEDTAETPAGASPGPIIPLISPRYQTLAQGEPKPFAPETSALLAPPPGQAASVNSLPAEDPAAAKAPAVRIKSVFESMVGFFENEAPGLTKIGDPSVQLPLATAKSDKSRLSDELNVLARNPGLDSSLTQEDITGVESNLAYLQRKWRQSVNAMSGTPMPPEGFQSGGFMSFHEGFQASGASGAASGASGAASGASGAASGASGASSGGASGASGASGAATLADLRDLKLKLSVEIVRLQASATTDLNIQARIGTLTQILQAITDLATDVERGVRTESSIPITKDNLSKFLPVMSNYNTALPTLFSGTGAPDILSSLFPKYATGDVSGASLAQALMSRYMKDVDSLSWDVNLHYKGKAEQQVAADYASAMQDAKLATQWGATSTPGSTNAPATTDNSSASAYRGMFDNVVKRLMGQDGSGSVSVSGQGSGHGPSGSTTTISLPPGTSRPAAHLDWKERSKQICAQIRARDMEPSEFGCLANPEKVTQENFSWRGYARMICNRLATNYDPSIPELCGCPPPTWVGWRP